MRSPPYTNIKSSAFVVVLNVIYAFSVPLLLKECRTALTSPAVVVK